jgi:hypothetical protein
MALTTIQDFQIVPEQFAAGYVDVLQENTNVFNTASGGAIRLQPIEREGEYYTETFWPEVDLIGPRDPTSDADQEDTAMGDEETNSIKVNRKIKPVAFSFDALRKAGKTAEEISFVMGEHVARQVAQDYVKVAVLALSAALQNVPALEAADEDAMLSSVMLHRGAATLGDQSQRIVAYAGHSKPYHDLVRAQINGTDAVDAVAGAVLYGAGPATFGKPFVASDNEAFYLADAHSDGTTDLYQTLALTAGAVTIEESEPAQIVNQLVTGKENLKQRIQGEYAFNVKLKGFAYDVQTQGVNPSDAVLASAASWTQKYASPKSLGGARIVTQ